MRNRIFTAIVCLMLTAAAISIAPRPVAAQGDQATVCDSTLVTLLYLAEHDYGFKSAMDVATIDKGQFKPLFDKMMASMEGGMMEATPDAMMMEATPDGMMMEATPDAMMGDKMMTELKSGVVQGENESCTKLRAEVEGFLYAKLSGDMMK